METKEITLDMDARCRACKKPGRVRENKAGLCLSCIVKRSKRKQAKKFGYERR